MCSSVFDVVNIFVQSLLVSSEEKRIADPDNGHVVVVGGVVPIQ